MIPSLVASEAKTALRDFLATRHRPSNAALASVVDEFLEHTENLVKGPYLSVQLPFARDPSGGEPFPEIPLGFTPFRHQRVAFARLRSGLSTVIATGTGSGKTECFLLPILDWCRQRHGKRGVKAIVIYPMNALAHDQSRRIARLVHDTPSLRGKVSAGLFVGHAESSPHASMTADHIVANRQMLLEWPPDILLTNYKMLDYLLSRPRDQRLWKFNKPDTLRWLVVDELHTFDGAQGTDLACLIRRLKARLGSRGTRLRCVGTSATLGAAHDGSLRDYVSEVFGEPFDEHSIVSESRMSIDQLLGSKFLKWHLVPGTDFGAIKEGVAYDSTETYLRTAYETLFGSPMQGDLASADTRTALADELKSHSSFVNLLRILAGRAKSLPEIGERLRASMAAATDSDALAALNGFCALIAAARRENQLPFLQLGLHLWVRELGRMVCSVEAPAKEPRDPGADAIEGGPQLRFSDDLSTDEPVIHLPLVQCRECHATAWGALRNPEGTRVDLDLRNFYNRFFSRSPKVWFLFPSSQPPRAKGRHVAICSACGTLHLGQTPARCSQCGFRRRQASLVNVFCPDSIEAERRRGVERLVLSRTCPYCDAKYALIVFGARSTPLTSVALGQAFGSRHNDDRKVIAFSDNVQDAAHRAGFYAARTWRNVRRTAIAQVVALQDGTSLADLPRRVVDWWSDPAVNPRAFDGVKFVSEFLAPDRAWLDDFKALRKDGRLPRKSNLPVLVKERLAWETLAEFGYLSNLETGLERTQVAAVGFDQSAFEEAVERAATKIRGEIGEFEDLSNCYVRQIALGVIRHMKDRGAFAGDITAKYLRSGGNRWTITWDLALPDVGPESPVPVFPADSTSQDDDRAGIEPFAKTSGATWYQRWVTHVLAPLEPGWAPHLSHSVLQLVLGSLEHVSLIQRSMVGKVEIWALVPDCFYITTKTVACHGPSAGHMLIVPEPEADLWKGVPCLDFSTRTVSPNEKRNCVYERLRPVQPTWLGRQYLRSEIRRVVAEEHTALLEPKDRERVQNRFTAPDSKPWDPNLLSATSTLELGIDIGDLSTVILGSVPPAQSNYIQRIGRAGRRDGNAFTLTVAGAQTHDQYFYADPDEMLNGAVTTPGVFLNASAVLERQLTAFCLDCWSASGVKDDAVPPMIGTVLNAVAKRNLEVFPHTFFRFVNQQAEDLLKRFFDAFEGKVSKDSKGDLERFMMGELGERPKLQYRILETLERCLRERASIRNEIQRLSNKIERLEAGPRDKSVEHEILQAKRERSGLRKLESKLTQRDTFNFLTDEGLVPNYEFPEEGVTLKSVILRGRSSGDTFSDDDAEVYDYVRPAAAALTELAPMNHFYAGGHHVEVDRVDLSLTQIESWRLCPSCPHCQKIDAGDQFSQCPRCGDPMWSDAGQSRYMLPMRLVHATTAARRGQIIDDRDDREPLFYNRHLVADVDPSSVSRAYALPPGGLPFGLEYSSKTTFREMNFGRKESTGSPTKFAGREMPREGFRVCRKCGKVQRSREHPDHTSTCSLNREIKGRVQTAAAFARADADGSDDAFVNCLYLYREFESEAIRMLLPISDAGETDERVHSFIAALERGLRLHFKGQVDHLRAMTTSMQDPDSNALRTYLVLYDTVPGGTGYLKQLMVPNLNLVELLEQARQALETCECAKDPLRDGCYRCVYAYRFRDERARPSRRVALEVLARILSASADLEEVDGLEGLDLPWGAESELEYRFLEALRRVKTQDGVATLHHEIVNGNAGYLLRLDDESWLIQPQANLGGTEGVETASRPDFLFSPARPEASKRPVAVFLDGFTYHQGRVDEDSLKRISIVRSGILQWSLTWRDLNPMFGQAADALDFIRDGREPSGQAAGPMGPAQAAFDQRLAVGPLRAQLGKSSFELLVEYLRRPDAQTWRRAVFVDLLAVFDRERMLTEALRQRFNAGVDRAMPPQAAEEVRDLGSPVAVGGRGAWTGTDPDLAELLAAVPLAAIKGCDPDACFAAVHLRDESQDRDQEGYQCAWNGVLRLFNLLQFLPNAWFTSATAIRAERYPRFPSSSEPASAPTAAGDDLWDDTIAVADESFHELLRNLRASGAPVPEVGYELLSAGDRVIAEAELAWPDANFAVFRDDRQADRRAFEKAGWSVGGPDVSLEIVRAAIAGQGNIEDREVKDG